MLEKNSIDFLKKLKKNNNRDWFEANRPMYEQAKANVLKISEAIIDHLAKGDVRFSELSAKQCLFRINRDVRFSKDKSPYKTNFGASFAVGGKKSPFAGYYLHIDPVNSFAGGGLWMPDAEKLKNLRQEIDYNSKEFISIVENKKFKENFGQLHEDDKLKNPPKGYAIDHELIEFLKLKSFVASRSFTEAEMLEKDVLKKIKVSFDTLKPMIDFINRTIE